MQIQSIQFCKATAEIKIGSDTYPAGSFIVKRDQPYGRLAKTLLEKQIFPNPALSTYDDSGWTQGLAMLVDVKEIGDLSILNVPAPLIDKLDVKGAVTGT